MACGSYECKKRFECAQHYLNVEADCSVEDYSHYGTGIFTDNGCEIEHWCGELGDYKMFQPILFSKQVKRYLTILDDVYDFLDDMDETAGLSSTVMESCENLMLFFSELYRLSKVKEQ